MLFLDVSDVEVDRDEDMSPQPHNVQFNGRDGSYLEVPPGENVPQPPPVNVSLPGSPQKKFIQPIIEESPQEGEVESNNSAER